MEMSLFPTADDWFDPITAMRRATRVCCAPLLVGGTLAILALAARTKLGAWLRGFLSARRLPSPSALRERIREGLPLPLLRDIVLGRRKSVVAELLGPPRSSGTSDLSAASVASSAFWRADVWYYAIDPTAQRAMAVTFDKSGMARVVDFFSAPMPMAQG